MLKSSLLCGFLVVGLAACNGNEPSSFSGGGSDQSGLSLILHESIDFRAATGEECPSGGGVYSLYVDQNANGLLDPTETVIHSQKLCNGVNGSDGYSSLFTMVPVLQIDTCASGTGLQINFGLDADRDGQLAAGEIQNSQVLCNGAVGADGSPGIPGAAGAPGSNGMNAVFTIVPAPSQICPNGGMTFLMAFDAFGTGVYTALDPNQESATVCNGNNGTNGTDGEDAPISAYTIVDTLMPCGKTVNYKEVLLRFANGQVLGSFSDNASGKNTRFAFLTDGTYVDTDNSSCTFSLSTSEDGKTRSMSWDGGERISWPMQ